MATENFGERLKRERELREVTLEEITSATRIGTRFLEALENEDWGKLPGGVFNRGFVRSVAKYLGLDEEGLLAEYDMAHGTKVPAAEQRPEVRIPSPPKWVPAAIVLGVVVLLAGLIAGGIYAWRYFAARRSPKQSETSGGPVLLEGAQQVPFPGGAATTPASTIAGAPGLARRDLFVSASCRNAILDTGGRQPDDLRAGENRVRQSVAGIERSSDAAAWRAGFVRYNEARPKRPEAGNRWNLSALKS